MSKYYVQRHSSGLVGNCMLFWQKDDCGYTCNLDRAKAFSEREAQDLARKDRGEKFTIWKKADLDAAAARHVDHQTTRRLQKQFSA